LGRFGLNLKPREAASGIGTPCLGLCSGQMTDHAPKEVLVVEDEAITRIVAAGPLAEHE
jgi:hypothetical protein